MAPTSPENPTLLDAFQRDMEFLGLTQEQLGAKWGISQQAVSRWFSSGRPPDDRVHQLAQMVRDANGAPNVQPWIDQPLPRFVRLHKYAASTPPRASEPTNFASLYAHREAAAESQHAAEQYEKEFFEALPPELRSYRHNRLNSTLQLRDQADYASDRCAVQFLGLTDSPLRHRALLELAVARQLDLAAGRMRTYLIVLPFQSMGPTALSDLMLKAVLLGVHVLTGTSAKEMAELIVKLEAGGSLQDYDPR